MNISIVNESLEYHNIERLSKFKAGLKVEVFVFISSLIILITTVPIVRYRYEDKFLSSLILYYEGPTLFQAHIYQLHGSAGLPQLPRPHSYLVSVDLVTVILVKCPTFQYKSMAAL